MTESPWSGIDPASEEMLGRRIDGKHPLDIYWVRASDGAPGLLFRGICEDRVPDRLPDTRGLHLEVVPGQHGIEARMFLRDQSDANVFLILCNDVIAWSEAGASPPIATERVFRRLSHWHSLLTRARATAMAAKEVRGLIGELVFLEILIERLGFETAVRSWVAPDRFPQDFALDSRVVEVKALCSGARRRVHISSLEQLAVEHLPLFLLVVELVPSSAAEGATLNDFCERIGARAAECGVDEEDAFQSALLKRGYVRQEAYDAEKYRVSGLAAFGVVDGFPRLCRAHVDVRIPEANYLLDLGHLTEFEVELDEALGRTGE